MSKIYKRLKSKRHNFTEKKIGGDDTLTSEDEKLFKEIFIKNKLVNNIKKPIEGLKLFDTALFDDPSYETIIEKIILDCPDNQDISFHSKKELKLVNFNKLLVKDIGEKTTSGKVKDTFYKLTENINNILSGKDSIINKDNDESKLLKISILLSKSYHKTSAKEKWVLNSCNEPTRRIKNYLIKYILCLFKTIAYNKKQIMSFVY